MTMLNLLDGIKEQAVITLSAKANSFLGSSQLQQQLLSLRLALPAPTLTADGSIRAY